MARIHRDAGGGDRWNALWGRGGRGMLAATLAIVALALPVSAYADDSPAPDTEVAAELVQAAESDPTGAVRVIIEARRGPGEALKAFNDAEAASVQANNAAKTARAKANKEAGDVPKASKKNRAKEQAEANAAADAADASAEKARRLGGERRGKLNRKLDLIHAVAVEVPAGRISKLAERAGLVIVPDSRVKASAPTSGQTWPHATGSSRLWANDEAYYSASMPTIAIVDSGIEDRADFAGRILADVKVRGEDAGDSRGHGTFVAGIAAGAAEGYAGAAPMARIFSVDVIDEQGMAYVSDVIHACYVILENKDAYNIRVANFSLHSATAMSVRWDPLAHAVERLWFNGIVVVASAGNYGSWEGPSGVGFAPGSDPFVITVGAGDLDPSTDPSGGAWYRPRVHSTAWWSAYGHTLDGFSKPDVVAPGRYMVGPVPEASTLASERAGHIVAPGYVQLSGTSFAAPVVSGTVAQILARHPEWTPDQVKGALMLTARPVYGAPQGAAGVGQITASKAVAVESPPNPNAGLNQFLQWYDGYGYWFEAELWGQAVQSDPAWNSAAWSDAAWASAAWSSAAWSDAAWSSASFETAAWSDAAWADAAWSDAAWADGAQSDATSEYSGVTPEQLVQLESDPELGEGAPPTEERGGEPPTEEPGSEPPTEEPGGEPPAEESGGEPPAEESGDGGDGGEPGGDPPPDGGE